MNTDDIVRDIEAVSTLRSAKLREVVVLTWVRALERGGYRHIRDVPQSENLKDRSLLDHVNDVNDLVQYLLRLAEQRYHLRPDRDLTMAASILHDVDKAFIQRRAPSGKVHYVDGYTICDHGPAGAELAKACGVPENVCELIRNHAPFNYDGHLPATAEGTILHYADLTAFDLSACEFGVIPIHAFSVMLMKTHPLIVNKSLD